MRSGVSKRALKFVMFEPGIEATELDPGAKVVLGEVFAVVAEGLDGLEISGVVEECEVELLLDLVREAGDGTVSAAMVVVARSGAGAGCLLIGPNTWPWKPRG